MARPLKRYQIRVRGAQRKDIDADLLLQALLLMAEEAEESVAAKTDAAAPHRRAVTEGRS